VSLVGRATSGNASPLSSLPLPLFAPGIGACGVAASTDASTAITASVLLLSEREGSAGGAGRGGGAIVGAGGGE